MSSRLQMNVTSEDIAQGKPINRFRCPIALAVKRILETPTLNPYTEQLEISKYIIKVDRSQLRIQELKGGIIKIYTLPTEATNFSRNFDDSRKTFPFSFTAELDYSY